MRCKGKKGSDLLRLVAGLPGRVVGVFYVCVGARAAGVLDEDVQVVLAVHQDLVLNYPSLLQVLQLLETHLLVVQLEHSLRFLRAGGQASKDQGFVLGHSDDHEPSQGDGQF